MDQRGSERFALADFLTMAPSQLRRARLLQEAKCSKPSGHAGQWIGSFSTQPAHDARKTIQAQAEKVDSGCGLSADGAMAGLVKAGVRPHHGAWHGGKSMDKRIDPWEGARSARALAWAIDHPAAPSAKVERSFARAVLISQGERRARGVFAGVALAWALALAEHALRALAMASASKWAQGSRGERSPELSSRERQELQASLGRAGLGRRGSGRPRL